MTVSSALLTTRPGLLTLQTVALTDSRIAYKTLIFLTVPFLDFGVVTKLALFLMFLYNIDSQMHIFSQGSETIQAVDGVTGAWSAVRVGTSIIQTDGTAGCVPVLCAGIIVLN